MRLTTTIAVLTCIAIAGCRETASCAEGQLYDPDQRACRTGTPSDSGGIDAPIDAGDFCDTCRDPLICDRENLECDECMPGVEPTPCAGATPVCGRTGQCVECEENAHCADPTAPVCLAAQCTACDENTDCLLVVDEGTALGVCDTARDPATCVQCTEATEGTQCAQTPVMFGCNRLTGRCADTPRSKDVCVPCEHDYECIRGRRCVDMRTDGGVSLGRVCLYDQSAGEACGDSDGSRRPFSRPEAATSVDGAAGTFCFLPQNVSCEAVQDHFNRRACTDPAICGISGVDDALCPGTGSCSYPCDDDDDCRVGTTCVSAGTPPYCSPRP